MSLEQLAIGLQRLWPVLERSVELDRRAFCIDRCEREIERADYIAYCAPGEFDRWRHGYTAALTIARKKLRLAATLPLVSHRFLGLDSCWLTLMGFRFAVVAREHCAGLEAVRSTAEELLKLPPGTAGRWTLDDLFRIYCEGKLAGTWTDGGRVYEPYEGWRSAA